MGNRPPEPLPWPAIGHKPDRKDNDIEAKLRRARAERDRLRNWDEREQRAWDAYEGISGVDEI